MTSGTTARRPTARDFIRENLRLLAVPAIPEIRLHTAHPGSGLRRLLGDDTDAAPYWAYPWSGGAVLARYILDRPEAVRGRRVLDLGAGGGIVAIAAALAGANEVSAAEIDANGVAALALNAEANGVAIHLVHDDLVSGPVPDTDLILVGDLFYERTLAKRVTDFLDRCVAAGIAVLVGDPGRVDLPHDRLTLLAEYAVPEVGATRGAAATRAAVFAFGAEPR